MHADYCWDIAGGSAVYILQGTSETTTKYSAADGNFIPSLANKPTFFSLLLQNFTGQGIARGAGFVCGHEASFPPPLRGRIKVGVKCQAFHPHPNLPPQRGKEFFNYSLS